jgi:transposase InsO family protein
MQTQGDGLTIREMCESARVSRASYYRNWRKQEPKQEQVGLRDAIQRWALKDRHCGYRRIGRWLKREGWVVNHKRVLRLMREDNLLSIRRRSFVVTTDSSHNWRVYPNLARRMVLSAINQLWVADITYVRLQQEFIYLAVILDVYSRRVVGWSISRHLDSSVAQQALEAALKQRRPEPGLIHHSDRGVQYACGDYVKRLEAASITISMSRPGNPWDNAWAESFMKTLKVEEVDGRRYRNFDHAASMIGSFIEETYNEQRLHSALDYLSPVEFEAEIANLGLGVSISTKKEKRTKKERKVRKGRPVETATAEEIHQRLPSATSY